jgi:hypothetical protein
MSDGTGRVFAAIKTANRNTGQAFAVLYPAREADMREGDCRFHDVPLHGALVAAVLLALISWPSAAAAHDAAPTGSDERAATDVRREGTNVTLEGRYRVAHADAPAAGRGDDVQQLDVGGRLITLRGPAGLAEPNQQIEVKGHRVDADTVSVDNVTLLGTAASHATTGTHSVLILLAYYTAPGVKTPEEAQRQIGTTAAAWYRETSYGLAELTATATPWLRVSDPGDCSSNSGEGIWRIEGEAEAQARALGYNPDEYAHVMTYFVDGGNHCWWAGLAYVDWRYSWIKDPYMDTRVTTHELGHNFGLWHSHSLDCGPVPYTTGCTSFDEYGDLWDTMGNCCFVDTPGHFNAIQKNLLGWMGSGRAVTQTAGNATYTLSAFEAAGTALRAVRVAPDGGRSYWLEKRSAIGMDAFLSSYPGVTNGVLVHVPEPGDGTNGSDLLDMTSTDSFYDAALPPGACWVTPEGVGIIVNRLSKTSAKVTVAFSRLPRACR